MADPQDASGAQGSWSLAVALAVVAGLVVAGWAAVVAMLIILLLGP